MLYTVSETINKILDKWKKKKKQTLGSRLHLCTVQNTRLQNFILFTFVKVAERERGRDRWTYLVSKIQQEPLQMRTALSKCCMSAVVEIRYLLN